MAPVQGPFMAAPINLDALLEEVPSEYTEEPEEEIVVPEDAIDQLPEFVVNHQLYKQKHLENYYLHAGNMPAKRDTFEDANLISSKIKGSTRHRVLLDLDMEAALIPSSTKGHYHLYLDHELSHEDMEELLTVLTKVGIIAQGNMNQWWNSKGQFLRLPWIVKGEKAGDDGGPKE